MSMVRPPNTLPVAEIGRRVKEEAADAASPARKNAYRPIAGVDPMPLVETPLFGRCRWPVDVVTKKGGFFFCGESTDLKTYCPVHSEIAARRAYATSKENVNGKGA